MSLTQNRWFRRLTLGAIAVLSLGAATVATIPAQAHEYGYQGRLVSINPASFFPRVFFGFGGQRHWDQHDHWDHRDYRDYHWR